jgi:hypothetical protein
MRIKIINKKILSHKYVKIGVLLLISTSLIFLITIYINRLASSPSTTANCQSNIPILENLESSSLPQISKLAEYENVCQSHIVSGLSLFTSIPASKNDAEALAKDIVSNLKEFSRFNITPIVFFEPTTNSGVINLDNIAKGDYDVILDSYFKAIKASNVDDSEMGTWVPLPEANTPVWSNVNPNTFSASVTKIIKLQKKYFPTSKSSILLNSSTYTNDSSWEGGQTISLLPYVKNITEGLLDSFGLQGFPWAAAANEELTNNGTPDQYLDVNLAIEASAFLNIKDIWLNTGTFGSKYVNQVNRTISITPEERLILLNQVTSLANSIQKQNFNVTVHLFSQDKSDTDEATDWSYWHDSSYGTSAYTYVFQSFVGELQASGIPLWLFDV